MSKDLVTKWFNKIAPSEHDKPLLILDGLAYTPRQTLDEVTRGTPKGDKLQSLIEQGRYGTTYVDEQALIKARLNMSLQTKPPDKILFVALPSSGLKAQTFTAPQLISEINRGTVIGQQWIEAEKSYMLRLLQVR